MSKVAARDKSEKYLLFSTSLMLILKQTEVAGAKCLGAHDLMTNLTFDFLSTEDLDSKVVMIKDEKIVVEYELRKQSDSLSSHFVGKKCKFEFSEDEVYHQKLNELSNTLGFKSTPADLSKYAMLYYAYKVFRCIPTHKACRCVEIGDNLITVWLKRIRGVDDFDSFIIRNGERSYIITFDEPPKTTKQKFLSNGGMLEIRDIRVVKKDVSTTARVGIDLGSDYEDSFDLDYNDADTPKID